MASFWPWRGFIRFSRVEAQNEVGVRSTAALSGFLGTCPLASARYRCRAGEACVKRLGKELS